MKQADIIIVGGGLAGLTAAIHLSRQGLKILLIEKNKFPHHKVCGEYLSNEVLPYLTEIGVNLYDLKPAKISKLEFSTLEGNLIETELDLGGIGISRFALDNFLYQKAIENGCQVIQAVVENINYKKNSFSVILNDKTEFSTDFVLGAFGKRSLLDKTLQRDFHQKPSEWLAVKAHYKNEQFPEDVVALHNFEGGYCGLSKTETGTVNACYLATYKSFKKYRGTDDFRENVLMENEYLKEFFSNSEMIFEKEISIAQVNFHSKSRIENHILMLGDAAGLIHPLCGNGMAMAIHSAKIASEILLDYFDGKETQRRAVEELYKSEWSQNFSGRMLAGRLLQKILMNNSAASFSQQIISLFPGLMPTIVKQTHGAPIK